MRDSPLFNVPLRLPVGVDPDLAVELAVGATLALSVGIGILERIALLVLGNIDDNVGGVGELALFASGGRDESVEPPGCDDADADENQADVANNEAENLKGILADLVEVGVGKTEDDGQGWGGDVAKERTPDDGDAPILAGSDDDVKVQTELLALISVSWG